jgi:hypothetical protein
MAYVHLHGHIGREPEVKSLGDKLVCTYRLADRPRLRPSGGGKCRLSGIGGAMGQYHLWLTPTTCGTACATPLWR